MIISYKYIVLFILLAILVFPEHCPAIEDPTLKQYRGKYFSWSAPPGWRHSESISGITANSPDTSEGIAYIILMRSRGQTSPTDFLYRMMRMSGEYANIRILSSRNLPPKPSGIPGTSWQLIEAEVAYSFNGKPMRGIWTSGVNAYYGIYDGMLIGYQAAEVKWDRSKYYLSRVAASVVITNIRQVAGNDTLIPVRNNPLDNSGLIKSGQMRDESRSRIGRNQRDSTMGTVRMKDPETGKIYTIPQQNYDRDAGGYRNPDNPSQLLVPLRKNEQ